MSERCDAVVIGAGPAGEAAVNDLLRAGLRVAFVGRIRAELPLAVSSTRSPSFRPTRRAT